MFVRREAQPFYVSTHSLHAPVDNVTPLVDGATPVGRRTASGGPDATTPAPRERLLGGAGVMGDDPLAGSIRGSR